jgi:hypothetical protein
MNILLAFKAEPDLSMLAETDWQVAGKGNRPGRVIDAPGDRKR